ncbi:MAG: aspartate/glutamate racemase family protein [Burkholderiales bacterium]|jgi:aspartate racemase|nr:aspartate/glutamate racemase family protein [Burkholderiales bacterium]
MKSSLVPAIAVPPASPAPPGEPAARKPTLGVLGGMGAMATVDFLRKLVEATPAERDQEHIPLIVRFCPEVPDRAAALAGAGPSPQPALVAAAVELAAAGAQALAIPCNTAHYWYDALCAAVPIPILHIVDAAVAELQRRGMSPPGRPKGESPSAPREGSPMFPPGRPKGESPSAPREGGPVSGPVGLLATSGTVHAAVYPQRAPQLRWVVPSAAELDKLVMPGIRAVKAQRLAEGRALLGAAAEALVARGARVIVLGCTEVPVALDPTADAERLLGVPLLDATAALAARCVAWARHGQTPVPQGSA